MKIVKAILGRLFAIWAIVTFIITFLVFFIPAMFTFLAPEPNSQAAFIKISRAWMNVWLLLVGCPVKIKGRENFIKGNTYIVIFNHNSLMDVPISCPYVPGANKTIAKTSFAKIPLFGFYYMKGSVLVDRKNEESRRQSYEKMKAVLNKGMHMCIYPEGTRNRTGQPLKKFHDGAFRLAVDTGFSIIPTIILNTKKVLPVHKTFYFWPSKLEMHFLPAINISNDGDVEELNQRCFNVMKEYLEKHDR